MKPEQKGTPGSMLWRLALLCPWLVSWQLAIAGSALVHDARIPQPPPGASVAAGLMIIENPSDTPLVISGVDVEGPGTVRAELHETTMVDDVARMREQSEIVVPANATLAFEHGGYHVMLMDLEESLVPGDRLMITFDTSEGPLEVELPVVAPGMAHRNPGGAGEQPAGMKKHLEQDGMDHADGGMDPALEDESIRGDGRDEGPGDTEAPAR